MHKYYDAFVEAIHARRKIKIIMKRKHKPKPLLATCAPLDFGPARATVSDCFHVWKYKYRPTDDEHTIAIEPEMLTRREVIDDMFDPADVVTWNTTEKPWTLPRDWGDYS